MSRLATLEDVLFPVEEFSVFAEIGEGGAAKRLAVLDKKAIVNTRENRVVGVVGRDYRLVDNRQALDWAYRCASAVFPHTKPDEWELHKVDAPQSGGHCYIDLEHKRTASDFSFLPKGGAKDVFGPFVRVTNSYNGQRALSFNVGYFRKVCGNGLILPRSVIRFSYPHSRKEIKEEITFLVAKDSLKELRNSLLESLETLRACGVPRADILPLFQKVLLLRAPQEKVGNAPLLAEWEALKQHAEDLCDRACEEFGENAYALFNAVTEFASHPLRNRCLRRERHALQRLAGDWTTRFVQECRKPDFTVKGYLSGGFETGALTRRDIMPASLEEHSASAVSKTLDLPAPQSP